MCVIILVHYLLTSSTYPNCNLVGLLHSAFSPTWASCLPCSQVVAVTMRVLLPVVAHNLFLVDMIGHVALIVINWTSIMATTLTKRNIPAKKMTKMAKITKPNSRNKTKKEIKTFIRKYIPMTMMTTTEVQTNWEEVSNILVVHRWDEIRFEIHIIIY